MIFYRQEDRIHVAAKERQEYYTHEVDREMSSAGIGDLVETVERKRTANAYERSTDDKRHNQ
jgi:hypothetical protein